MVSAYHRRLTGKDEAVREAAAAAWTRWEMATSSLAVKPEDVARAEDGKFALAFARIENHYFVNKGFFKSETCVCASCSGCARPSCRFLTPQHAATPANCWITWTPSATSRRSSCRAVMMLFALCAVLGICTVRGPKRRCASSAMRATLRGSRASPRRCATPRTASGPPSAPAAALERRDMAIMCCDGHKTPEDCCFSSKRPSSLIARLWRVCLESRQASARPPRRRAHGVSAAAPRRRCSLTWWRACGLHVGRGGTAAEQAHHEGLGRHHRRQQVPAPHRHARQRRARKARTSAARAPPSGS